VTRRKSFYLNQTRAYRFVAWALIAFLIAGVGASALLAYGSTRLEDVNAYYGKLLHRTELSAVHGPHYWKDGNLFWVGSGYVKTSGDLGATSSNDMALPEPFHGRA